VIKLQRPLFDSAKIHNGSLRSIMFDGLFQPMHLLIIFGIALLVYGPKKLPELGKGIGDSIRGFKSAMKDQPEASDKGTSAKEQGPTNV